MSRTHIVLVSSSPSPQSRSRALAQYAQRELDKVPGFSTDFLDLNETPLPLYPGSPGDTLPAELASRFNAADAWIMAGPVYNGGVSAHLINFLHYALDTDGKKGRPFFLIAGAGGGGSAFAFDELGARIRREVRAVEVGTPVVVTGDTEAAHARLNSVLSIFIPMARACVE